jgi:hypothetical protein
VIPPRGTLARDMAEANVHARRVGRAIYADRHYLLTRLGAVWLVFLVWAILEAVRP